MTQKQKPPKESAPIIGHALRLIAYELSIIGTREKEQKKQESLLQAQMEEPIAWEKMKK